MADEEATAISGWFLGNYDSFEEHQAAALDLLQEDCKKVFLTWFESLDALRVQLANLSSRGSLC